MLSSRRVQLGFQRRAHNRWRNDLIAIKLLNYKSVLARELQLLEANSRKLYARWLAQLRRVCGLASCRQGWRDGANEGGSFVEKKGGEPNSPRTEATEAISVTLDGRAGVPVAQELSCAKRSLEIPLHPRDRQITADYKLQISNFKLR
jgi:hypothetical protein